MGCVVLIPRPALDLKCWLERIKASSRESATSLTTQLTARATYYLSSWARLDQPSCRIVTDSGPTSGRACSLICLAVISSRLRGSALKAVSESIELRNRIYELIILDLDKCISKHQSWGKRCVHCPVMINVHKVHKTRRLHKQTTPQQTYLGLTQTCRAIRNEFRILYLRAVNVVVPLDMIKHYTETFLNGIDYRDQLNGVIRVSGPTRRLYHSGVDVLPFVRQMWKHNEKYIFSDESSFSPYDNALVDMLRVLCHYACVFRDLVEAGHIYQIRLREIPPPEDWEDHNFDDNMLDECTPTIVVSLRLYKEYGLRWSPATGQDMPGELLEVLNGLKNKLADVVEFQCDAWDED